MPTDNVAFVGSIPENYDRYLGPVLFEPYARDLVARINVPEGGSLLEVACGTGIVTRQLRDRLSPNVKIVATDLNEAMISFARQKFRSDENVEWKPADALDLPFDDGSFDAVVCQFGLMFFPDKQRGVSEAYRVLKPDGQYTFNVWDAIKRVDLAKATETVIKQFFPENPPDFYDIPFSFHEEDKIQSVLSAAGFRETKIDVVPFPCVSASARDAAHGLIHGNPRNQRHQRTRSGESPGDRSRIGREDCRAIRRRAGQRTHAGDRLQRGQVIWSGFHSPIHIADSL